MLGRVVGRALWWGRDHTTPIALDVWDADPGQAQTDAILVQLLSHGHDVLRAGGVDTPLPHTMRVPTNWRESDAIRADVRRKTRAAAVSGLVRSNERRQFQWDAGQPLPPEPANLAFEPADDDTFVRLFSRAAHGSLDVMTRRELETTDAEDLARAEVDYYRSCPGEREWWREGVYRGVYPGGRG